MAERYRDLQRPTLLDTGVVDDSDVGVAQQLADTFEKFERKANAFSSALSAQRGEEQGAAAGATGKPELRRGMRALTAYGQAYNNSALRSYVIKAEADANDTAARLEQEAGSDPAYFQATFSKVRDEVMKTAEPGARAAIEEVFTRRMSDGVTRIELTRAKEVRVEQRASVAEGLSRAVDAIGQLRASDDPDAFVRSEEEEVKLNLLIDSAVADRTLSITEGAALKVDAARSIVKQTVSARFARELDSPYGDPIGFIEKLREANKTSEALPPAEEEQLQTMLLGELRERNTLRNARTSAMENERQLRYANGDRAATSALLSGKLTQRHLLKMVNDDALDPSVARTLLNELQAGDPGSSDPRELFTVETNLLETTEEEIRSNASLSWSDRSRLVQKRREEAAGWRGTQQAREGSERIDRALGIAPGTMRAALSEEEARQRDQALTEWYNLVDALPPEERQAKAIELAEQVNARVMKGNARGEVERIRARIQRMQTTYPDLDAMSKRKREVFDAEMKRLQDRLREAEQRAK